MKAAALALALGLAAAPALALDAGEQLADPAQEARARALGRELRCPVCQAGNIDDSAADLARDLRRLVRERIAAGDSDAQVRAALQARYGDFVLLEPPLRTDTLILWGAPLLLLIGAGTLLVLRQRRQPVAPPPPALDDEERAALARLDP